MTSAASPTFQARRARNGDLHFLATLFANDATNPDRGFTYPSCENAGDLIDELRAYGLSLEEGMMIVERAGEPIGCFGFLYEPEELRASTAGVTAFLVGPLLAGAVPPPRLMRAMFDTAENEAASRGLRALRSCVASAGLIDILSQRHWLLEGRSLEMKLECGNALGPIEEAGDVYPLQSGSPRAAETAKLLADAFGWGDDAARRLQVSLDDRYDVAYVERDGAVAGVAVWYGVAPFARIRERCRAGRPAQKWISSVLLRAAVASLRSMGRETVYLALDPDNTAAREFYRRHGFVETEVLAVYRFELRPGRVRPRE